MAYPYKPMKNPIFRRPWIWHGDMDFPFYDALYLELAMRQRADLATLDRALGRVAASEGVRALTG